MSFTYNDEGIRTSKTVNGVTTHYYLNGSQILAEETNGNITLYVYDVAGSPIGYQYHGANYAADAWDIYWYEKNPQGDIVAVYNQAGTKLVYYRYTAYGEFTARSSITGVDPASIRNPFTYRGYYYDYDLGLYYLNSRYYDANTCRFINADGYVSTGTGLLGYNMYAYCNNNPVMYVDPTGEEGILAAAGTAIIVLLCAAAIVSVAYVAATVITEFVEAVIEVAQVIAEEKEEEKDIAIPDSSQTVIYRYGGTNPGNLTPKEKDKYSGLSFSTIPKPGAAMTTIEALNATGVVYAVQDGPNHVSVRPIGATMEDWINAGSDSIWTQAVKSVVVKWDGGN